MRRLIDHHLRVVVAMAVTLLAVTAWAHEVNDVDIRVVINDLGHARVVEVRQCQMGNSGTEGYIKQYNLHGMRVGEIAVSDETGVQYEVDKHWNLDRSRGEKTNHCGINKVDKGVELCWGIGASGPRIYNIHYTLGGLVNSLDDYDGFNFRFYEPASGAYAQHVRVTIEREKGVFTPEDTRIWAFRYHGQINLIDGKIVAETEEPFQDESEGIVIMAQFNKGLFHPVATRKGTFLEKFKKPAFKGSDYTLTDEENNSKTSFKGGGFTNPDDTSIWQDLWELISTLLEIGLWIFIPCYFIYELFNTGSTIKTAHQNQRLFGNKEGEMREWSRDIPLNGDLYRTSQVLHAVKSSDVKNKDQIAAVVMRMTHLGLISLRPHVNNKGENIGEFLVTPPMGQANSMDPQAKLIGLIHQQMWNAAGQDHVLQPKEMNTYMREYPVEHRAVVRRITELLSATGRSRGNLQPDEVRQVYGLKKFLQEFTLLEERHVLEVGLWKEYMVFATLYGIAKQVFADLKQSWSDYTTLAPQEALLMDTDITTTVANYTLMGMSYVSSYETPAEREARLEREREARRSSGGGGSSSYGGGGGFSGGGGSGFR